ncbi:MAG: GNAT family N-acetyltransferase [Eubacteriales bacterium]
MAGKEVSEITLEIVGEEKRETLRGILRDDIPEAFVDSSDAILDIDASGAAGGYIVHTYAVKRGDAYVGWLFICEAVPWETDPPEMGLTPFYRLMGFVIDRRYRGMGIGSCALEAAIAAMYREYGVRPIALGVHRDNTRAAAFYLRHGFQKTAYREGNDTYYLRYPSDGETPPV